MICRYEMQNDAVLTIKYRRRITYSTKGNILHVCIYFVKPVSENKILPVIRGSLEVQHELLETQMFACYASLSHVVIV